jgi:DNA-binding beta-propeller fold protein YncE
VPTAGYTPLVVTEVNSGRQVTVYNRDPTTLGHIDNLYDNQSALDSNYKGVDISLTKRMSNRWMALGSLSVGKNTGDVYGGTEDLNNPNFPFRTGLLTNDRHTFFKMSGAYELPATRGAAPQRGGGGRQDLARVPAKELRPDDPGPPQFNTVHGVKVSNDGLVYVSDRGGKRVQVFTIDGKFLKQAWIDRWCEAPRGSNLFCGSGDTTASTAFSADPEQRFLYVASRSPARIWVYDRKTLEPLDSFGRPGVAPGEFYVLHHMTADSKGNLYASEVEDGRRIQKFVFKGLTPAPRESTR